MDTEYIQQILRNYEKRLQALEIIHTRYQGSQGPAGPKGDPGAKGADADLTAMHFELQSFRDSLRSFKNEIHDLSVSHLTRLEEISRDAQARIAEIVIKEVEAFCALRDEAVTRINEG